MRSAGLMRSAGRMRSRQAADTPKLAALKASAGTAPNAWAASPAKPRPAIVATLAPPCSWALPATRSAALIKPGRATWYAVAKKTLAVPASSATATSWPTLSPPSQAATGRLAYSSAEITSQPIISGRTGSRSTQAPAGRPITSHGR